MTNKDTDGQNLKPNLKSRVDGAFSGRLRVARISVRVSTTNPAQQTNSATSPTHTTHKIYYHTHYL